MREPDLKGYATAWQLNAQPDKENPATAGTLIHFLVNCPWAHPLWSQYVVIGIHLRDIPGVPPAKKHFPEAGYEILIISLDPKVKHDPDLLDSRAQKLSMLMPPDLCHQVSSFDLDDAQFKRVVTDIVQVIVTGKASPDVDYRTWWKNSINKTVEHLKAGKHQVQ